MVLAVDPDPEHVSYGNTVKKEGDVAWAHACGVRRFAVDCDAELDKVLRRAPGTTVLVRLSTSGAGADWALGGKFGCDEETALRLLSRAVANGHPAGLCFHVGSQQRRVDAWDAPLAGGTPVARPASRHRCRPRRGRPRRRLPLDGGAGRSP